jgi:hypothetical protein
MVLLPKFMGGLSRRASSPGRPSGPEKAKYRTNVISKLQKRKFPTIKMCTGSVFR